MRMKISRTLRLLGLLSACCLAACTSGPAPEIQFLYEENISLPYEKVIDAYARLAAYYPQASLREVGQTDSGKPLHLFMVSKDGDFDPASLRAKGRCVVLLMNGIHAGEPVGIDASLQYAADILANPQGMGRVLDHTALAIIPVYNVDGALNTSPYRRLNQDGPLLKGARRNARNLDLNRDFVKQEARTSRSFARLFHTLDPDVFLDTHTTNGADHQQTMTLIPSMYQKYHEPMGRFFNERMMPALYERMQTETPWGMVPYVQTMERGNVRSGIRAFNDHPYFSSGYANLFNTLAMITETQVSKPFPDRVRATYDFTRLMMEFVAGHHQEILALRADAKEFTRTASYFVLDWSLDHTTHQPLLFKGYETTRVSSPVTGRQINRFDHDRPWTDTIPYYNQFMPRLTVEAPKAYLVPGAWEEIIERLLLNGVKLSRLEGDTVLEVEIIHIENFLASAGPVQGRQVLSQVDTRTETAMRQFFRGDALVFLNQERNNYIVHALEPLAPASFFSWGFFNATLEDGEWFNLYAFEELFHDKLLENDSLRMGFEEMKVSDPEFATDPLAQLQYLYEQLPRPKVINSAEIYPISRIR